MYSCLWRLDCLCVYAVLVQFDFMLFSLGFAGLLCFMLRFVIVAKWFACKTLVLTLCG